jgi:hypothetical protein
VKPSDKHSLRLAVVFLTFAYGVIMPVITPTASVESAMQSLGVTPFLFWAGAVLSIPLSVAFSYFAVHSLTVPIGSSGRIASLLVDAAPSYAAGVFVNVTLSLLGLFEPNGIGYLSMHACTALAFGFGGRMALRCNSVAPIKEK